MFSVTLYLYIYNLCVCVCVCVCLCVSVCCLCAEESWAKGLVVAPAAGTSPGCVHVRLEDGQIVQPSAKPESGEVRLSAL